MQSHRQKETVRNKRLQYCVCVFFRFFISLCFCYASVMIMIYASVMFLKCSWFCFSPFYYTDKTFDSEDNIPISKLVLKRKALDDEQEEDEEDEEEEDEPSSDPGLCSLCFHYASITLMLCFDYASIMLLLCLSYASVMLLLCCRCFFVLLLCLY